MNGKKSTMLPVPSALESATEVVRIPEVLLNFFAGSLVSSSSCLSNKLLH